MERRGRLWEAFFAVEKEFRAISAWGVGNADENRRTELMFEKSSCVWIGTVLEYRNRTYVLENKDDGWIPLC